MVCARDLTLLGLAFCGSLVSAIDSTDSVAPLNDGSHDVDAAYYIPSSKRTFLKSRADKCDKSADNQRTIAYYESWAGLRDCNPFHPSDIDPMRWSHINFAFAVLDKSDNVVPSAKGDEELYKATTGLKSGNENLQVWIAVGGDGMGGKPFSKMASSNSSRSDFIHSAKNFMDEHGFDGIDIDWEYPAVKASGGKPEDKENLVTLVKEMRTEFGKDTGISMTVPARSYYLDGFDLKAMQSDLDMINFMSYDLHGSWDQPLLAESHTNLTEIDKSLQRLKDDGISMDKINLGLAYYGYAYILEDDSCTKPGCAAKSMVKQGPCGKTQQGLMDFAAIEQVIGNNSVDQTKDEDAAVMYFTWDKNHWIAYDDNTTLEMKADYAQDQCLGGTFVWALDMEDSKEKKASSMASGNYPSQLLTQVSLAISFCIFFLSI